MSSCVEQHNEFSLVHFPAETILWDFTGDGKYARYSGTFLELILFHDSGEDGCVCVCHPMWVHKHKQYCWMLLLANQTACKQNHSWTEALMYLQFRGEFCVKKNNLGNSGDVRRTHIKNEVDPNLEKC